MSHQTVVEFVYPAGGLRPVRAPRPDDFVLVLVPSLAHGQCAEPYRWSAKRIARHTSLAGRWRDLAKTGATRGGYRPGCSCLLSHPRAGVARGFVGVYRRVLLASRVVGGQRRSSLTAA